MRKKVSKRQRQYLLNKDAKVGETIKCCVCGEAFVKRQYSQAFCSPNCKDTYWNAKNSNRHKDSNYHRKYNNSVSDLNERKRRIRYAVENTICIIGSYANPNDIEEHTDAIIDSIMETIY